jgi:BirA family transcriptional regulator, biotin operon repressor / biotin---[acetyl-CoA-carboxylase] ligase
MTSAPSTWGIDRRRLAHTRFSDVRFFDQIGSTNSELMAEARLGGSEGMVAVTDSQTAGRGRLGRMWSARPGTSLLVSVLLRPQMSVNRLGLVVMTAALAAADGVARVAGFRPGLKWPNDLVVADRKLAGVLAESAPGGGDVPVVVGIGLNVSAGAFPPELAGAATTCEDEAGRPVDRAELLVAFLEALETRYAGLFSAGGSEQALADYRADSATLGRRVRVELANGAVEGLASQIAWNGQLVVVDDDGGHVAVHSGDVVHLHPAEAG